MDNTNSSARLQFDEEAGTLQILLLVCRIGDRYYPGSDPLPLAIEGRKEAWDLVTPLLELLCKNHENAATVVHRGTRHVFTLAVWRALGARLQDYLESVELGLPATVDIVAKPLA